MKAPISDRVRQILSDPGAAHDLVKQVIESRRGHQNGEIRIGKERFELVRIMERTTKAPDTKA